MSFLLSLLFPAFFRGRNDRIIDGFFRLRYRMAGSGEISPDLVHVVIDDSTYSSLGLPDRDRAAFARSFDLLQEAGARLIACDVLFRDPGLQETDRLLVEAAGKARKVIMPVLVRAPEGSQLVAPFPALSAQAAGFGHINAAPDPDGRIRRLALVYRHQGGYLPALCLTAVLEYLQVDPQALKVSFGRHVVLPGARVGGDGGEDLVIPIDREGRIRINFAGPTEAFQSFPMHKLLAARQEQESRSHLQDLLEGALVLLSDTSTANKDYGPGIFESVYPLSGLHLNAINSILTGRLLSEQRIPGAVPAAVLLALALVLCAARFRTPAFCLAGILLYSGFLAGAFILFLFARIAASVVVPTLASVLAVASTGLLGLLRAERERSSSRAGLQTANHALAEQRHALETANNLLAKLSLQSSSDPVEEPGGADRLACLLRHPEAFSEIVTGNRLMLNAFKLVEAFAEDTQPVLITGESGVGKELLAKAIHRLSQRRGKFLSENIGGLDDTLFTDTLFGHAPGAYTDARNTRKGLVEEAAGGTLFLDEIGDLSIGSQVKLLRLIDGKEYRPLGVDQARFSEARFIIATNVDLEKKLEEGKFRQDLYFRLTHRIHLPPLRERLDDLSLLVDHFLRQAAQDHGAQAPAWPRELLPVLESFAFPGNIRELKNMLDNAWNGGKELSLSYFRECIRKASSSNLHQDVQLRFTGKFPSLQEVEQAAVAEALKRANGNQSSAARLLGLSASALSRRLRHYRESEVRG